MPFGEGGYKPKNIPELRAQLKNTDAQVSGGDTEASLTPPSIKKQDILKMPIEEIKEKYARRYQMYLELVRDRKYIENTGDVRLTEEDQADMKKWLTALNSLDQYILDYRSGKESTLWERQAAVFDDTRKFLEAGGTEGYIKLPTGSGKTVLFTEFIEALNLRTLVVVPRDLLITQTEETFAEHAPDIDIGEVSGKAKEFGRQVTIITYDSLLLQLESGQIKPEDFDCLILDEVHMSLSKKRMAAVKKFDKAIKLGFTATPKYSEKKKVSNLLEKEIHQMSIREAIEDEGMLAPMSTILARTQVDLSSVPIDQKTKDFSEGELARAVNVAGRNQKAVEFYKENFNGQTAVVFCVGIEHADEVARLYNEAGIPAAAISSKTKNKKEILKKYKSDAIKVLCNADLLIAGFDEPRASICINLRPTRSRVVAEQRGGRVLRLNKLDPDKYAFVVDFIDKNIPDDCLPVLFADVAEGAQFELKKNKRKGFGKGQEGRGRPPILSIPGLDVTFDAEEMMQIVRDYRERTVREAEKKSKFLSFVDLQTEVRAANIKKGPDYARAYKDHAGWPSRPDDIYTRTGEWPGWDKFFEREQLSYTDLQKVVQAAGIKTAPQYFTVYKEKGWPPRPDDTYDEWENWNKFLGTEGRAEYTSNTAHQKLEVAFAKWQALPVEGRDRFGPRWLTDNGYTSLYNWSTKEGNPSLVELAAVSTNKELQTAFAKMRKRDRTEVSAIKELELAFAEWQTLPLETREDFSQAWLKENGYAGLAQWAIDNTSLTDLVAASSNEALRAGFKKVLERTFDAARLELEAAFAKWKAQPVKDRGKFTGTWLSRNGYGGLTQWSYKNEIPLSSLVAVSPNEELKASFEKLMVRGRTHDTARLELEAAFAKWQALPAEGRAPFGVAWLMKNRYGGLYQWSLLNTSLVDLAFASTNKELKKVF